jgi:ribosome biogenesis protein SSF1/2
MSSKSPSQRHPVNSSSKSISKVKSKLKHKKKQPAANNNNNSASTSNSTVADPIPIENDGIPRSLVIRRGRVGKYARELVQDLRSIMSPYTATKLRERKTNTIKDFINVAPVLGVTHILAISQTKSKSNSSNHYQPPNLTIGRIPHGPTITFKILEYSLSSKLRKTLKNNKTSGLIKNAFINPPLVVLNNFEQEGNPKFVQLVGQYFHHMFPGLDVSTVKISECRRVLLVHYVPETEEFEVRQYYIKAEPQGASRPLRKIIKASSTGSGNAIPDLSRVSDVAEVIERNVGFNAGDTSDSEMDDPQASVMLPADFGHRSRGNRKGSVSIVKLKELGPRLTLKCVKVQENLFDGEVTYHAYHSLTQEELLAQRAKVEENKTKLEERRKIQQENVERKRALEEEKQERKRIKIEARKVKLNAAVKRFKGDDNNNDELNDDDNDNE